VENIKGRAYSMIYVKPWTQFFDLKGKEEVPFSYSEHITLRNIELECDVFFDVAVSEHDRLTNITFDNLKIIAKNNAFDKKVIDGLILSNVTVNGQLIEISSKD
jgi:hypothetical protein